MTSKTTSHDDDSFDFGKVEKEAKSMVAYDEQYWLENDAKFRAVGQKVATYEEFREIVMAAHLKPLEKEDKISSMGTFTQVWNQSALRNPQQNQGDKTSEKASTGLHSAEPAMKLPDTGQEFLQTWKRECKTLQQKKQFIMAVGATKTCTIFKTEISGGLLGDLIECLLHEFYNAEAQMVIELLEALSKSQRFSLSLAFLSRKEKEQLSSLFDKLASAQEENQSDDFTERITVLKEVYSVK